MARRDDSEKKSHNGLGVILWFLAALILVILFVSNHKRIASNLKSTGFFNKVFGRTPAFVENAEIQDTNEKNDIMPVSDSSSVQISVTDSASSSTGIISENEEARKQRELSLQQSYSESADAQDSDYITPYIPPAAPNIAYQEESGETMKIKLFFMVITSDGSINRKEVVRIMNKTDSPLADAINALINGPTEAEDSQGCRSLVSTGTRLLGAGVRGGVATLNFSGEFEFNQYGIEGTRGQLQQIVYTATAFPTVESVQFLIEGEHRDYIGGEGVWIGEPLSRSSF